MLFFTSPCVVCFLSLYTYFFMYTILYFCFILICLDEFCLKCFRKTDCENLPCHELSSCKVFQEFVLGLDFIVFKKVIMSLMFYDFSYTSFVCCSFVTDCQRGRLLGHMWILLETYVM